ncbi:MAG: thioredoxin family protein [Lewinella sp.]|nr:thioredoxin family protein [Lewinella sp.]
MLRLFIASLLLSTSLSAQEMPANWFSDYAAAQAYAEQHDGSILMVFAGSDWCRPCIQFKQDILTSVAFTDFTQGKLAILYLDFPARRKNQLPAAQTEHNEALAARYNPQGSFPKIVLLDTAGRILAEPAFKGQTPEQYMEELTQDLNL